MEPKKIPSEAEKIRNEWEKNLDEEMDLLKKRQVRADEGAEKRQSKWELEK